MDMDPITRREARKIELVLLDLVHDLELAAYLPLDFDLWLRDDVIHLVDKASSFLEPEYLEDLLVDNFPSEMEERQKLLKARCFLRAASHYGDPADSEGNEAVLQVAEYGEVERHLREAASTVGTVGAEELEYHHLSFRALVDTLKTGGYAKEMRAYLQQYFPRSSSSFYHSSSSSLSSSATSASAFSSSPSTSTSCSSSDVENGEYGGQGRGTKGDTTDGEDKNRSADVAFDSFPSVVPSSQKEQPQKKRNSLTAKQSGNKTALKSGQKKSPNDKSNKNPTNQKQEKKKKKKKKEKEEDVPYVVQDACSTGMVNPAVENLRHVVHRLYRMIQLRNTSTVNDDVHRYKVLHEAVNKEQSATADVQALNREYEEVKASRKAEVAVLDDEIRKLEEELRYVQRAADVELEAFHEVSEKIEKDHRQGYQEQLEVHRQAAEAVKEKMRRAQLDHTEKTNQLRSLRAKKEAAVSGAITEYEEQMSGMTAAMKKLQKEYEEETAKVLELEDQLQVLQKEKKEYEVEQQVKERRERHHLEIREELEHDARVLQAYFRAYLARTKFEKEVTAKAKKKKKKKKSASR